MTSMDKVKFYKKPSFFLKCGSLTLLIGYLPIGIYSIFGPADGNPIGLGLLVMVSTPIGCTLIIIGVIKLLLMRIKMRSNPNEK